MRQIHPISEESCKEHYGKPVLVIMKDGSEISGILTKLDNGKLILNGDSTAATTNAKASKRKTGKNKSKAKVSFSPFPLSPFGSGIVLDLALIAFLFAFL